LNRGEDISYYLVSDIVNRGSLQNKREKEREREIIMMDSDGSSRGSSRDSSGMDIVYPDYTLAVEGMMCQKNCGSTVENSLRSVSGD
jgi:hypothetical protein